MLRELTPASVGRRGPLGRAFAHAVRAYVVTTLRRLAASSRPVLVGPWVSEVGFELLYWVPFLRWAVKEFGLPRDRLIALSRGGADPWYDEFCGQYLDAFDAVSLAEYRKRNTARLRKTRGQKQMVASDFDSMLITWARRTSGNPDALVLHPALMHNLFRPFWWTALSAGWVRRHTVFGRFPDPRAATRLSLPPRYIAAKFYFNEGFPSTAPNRRLAAWLVREAQKSAPVVFLATGLELDDHRDLIDENTMTITEACTPRNNLAVQSAVLASASAFVGTYGGFSYLAPAYGVPTVAVYGNQRGFFHTHLRLARDVFDGTQWTVRHVPGEMTTAAADIRRLGQP